MWVEWASVNLLMSLSSLTALVILHVLKQPTAVLTLFIYWMSFYPLQCDGQYIPLPSLQGIAVLNIPSYAGGTNFWGGTKEDDVSNIEQK